MKSEKAKYLTAFTNSMVKMLLHACPCILISNCDGKWAEVQTNILNVRLREKNDKNDHDNDVLVGRAQLCWK